jgi:hypothetical protein
MPELTEAELRRLVSQHTQADPRPGTHWRETETGRVVRIVNKPFDPDTMVGLVAYYESGRPIYCSTVERFLADITMPDNTTRPRFEPDVP